MLYIDKLSNEFGVSTTSVRGALAKLKALDLVTSQRNKGAIDVLEMRRLLETYGCRSAAKEIIDEEISKPEEILNTVNENPDDFEYYKSSDLELHGAIIKHIKNEVIREALTNLSIHSRRIRYYAEKTPFVKDVILKVTNEHESILEALKLHDPLMLEKQMREHLFKAQQRTLEALDNSQNISDLDK